MNIVKPSKKSNLPFLQKKSFSDNTSLSAYISTLLLAALIGTYLDLYFVGKNFYEFPKRLFPDIFSINIVFTLICLPIFTLFFIYLADKMSAWLRFIFIFANSLIIGVLEKQAEVIGLFKHSDNWNHYYSVFGYLIFMLLIWGFYKWRN